MSALTLNLSKLKTKNKLAKVAFVLNGVLFLMGGVLLIGEGKNVFGIIQFLASILNIAILLNFRNKRSVSKLNIAIFVINLLVCLSISLDYFLAGKSYIQYLYIVAAIISFVALRIQMERSLKEQK